MKRIAPLMFAVVLVAVSCGDDDGVATTSGNATADPLILRPDVVQTLELTVGERARVLVEGSPSTGFIWELATDPRCVEPVGSPRFVPRSELLGGAGDYIFTFEATEPGVEQLSFVYHRPWESVPALTTATLGVTVHAG